MKNGAYFPVLPPWVLDWAAEDWVDDW
jgi:hypothetical protein